MEHYDKLSGDSSGSRPFVIRIVALSGQVSDWRVDSVISFHDVLDVLSRVDPDSPPTAFEYEDEDSDRITVRSDEELSALLNWYTVHRAESINHNGPDTPLIIYPRVCRSPLGRNLCGLTVDTTKAVADPQQSNGIVQLSNRKPPEDLKAILASGKICHQDISLLNLLGHGNSGTVYRALHTPTKQVLAVKIIPLDVTHDVQKEIISELEILFQCHSPFIIGFYGAFFMESKISVCTEYMDGGSLDAYGMIPENVLGAISAAVVKGLVYLWGLKIMHRDVKPSNILVTSSGEVKLCDFGVSIQLVNSIAETYVGTNAYMAPERILGDPYGIYSDVWSLGLSLVEMALGKFPYPQGGGRIDLLLPIALLQCIVNEDPPKLPTEQFSSSFADFVENCLQKQPQRRPLPQQLMEHVFIKANDSHDKSVVACFIQERLGSQATSQETIAGV